MTRLIDITVPDLYADPFREQQQKCMRAQAQLLGARIRFESNSTRLLRLAMSAYAGLPAHRLSASSPRLNVQLLLRPAARARRRRRSEPPALEMFSGSGWLGAGSQASDFVLLSPQLRRAMVVVSEQTLRYPYHARYELVEFAVFTLAARCQRLASLHAACVGLNDRGVLLIGPSGSGKSTVTMLCLLQGFDFLSEDSVFVAPRTMRATGVANFLHVRADSLKWVTKADARRIRQSPVIQRRSGVRKYEVDLRTGGHRLAGSPQKIAAVVFLSEHSAGKQPLLLPLSRPAMLARLAEAQAYVVNQPEWPGLAKAMARLNAYELRRGGHPNDSVNALRALLSGG